MLLCAPGAAAQANEGAEQLFFGALPVVLSASRLPQARNEVPGAVTVIDRELIHASGYRDLARLLRLVPGMQVGQERGHYHWVTYHGLGNDFPTEMQVMIDGRSVFTPSSFGGVDWSNLQITLDEIDRIEVVRGTNANAYGANAFLGTVNIITRHSADAGDELLRVRAGGDGLRDLEAGVHASVGAAQVRLAARSQRDRGFDAQRDDRITDAASLRADLRPDAANELTLRLGLASALRGEGYAGSSLGNNDPRDSRASATTVHLQWRHTPREDEEWLLSIYRNHEKVRDRWRASAPPLFPAVPLDRDRQSVRDNLELQHRLPLADHGQLVWGLEWRRDEVDSPFLFSRGNPPELEVSRAFANLATPLADGLQLSAGALLEHYSGAPAQFAPRLFLNWTASPEHTLRAGVARAYRQLNQFERYGDIRATDPASGAVLVRPYLANPGLRQTRVDSLELGYLGHLRSLRSTVDLRLFDERIHDFVLRVPQPDPAPRPLLADLLGSARYENLGRSFSLRGLEYEIDSQPWPGTRLRLAHALIARDSGSRDIDRRTAPYTASLSWLQAWRGGWGSTLTLLRAGAIAGGDGFVPRFDYSARPYTTWDAHLYRDLQISGRRARLSLAAVNLGPAHQEVPDRSMQFLQPDRPVNPTSSSIWLALEVAL